MRDANPVHVCLASRGSVLAARDHVRQMLQEAEASDGPILLDATGLTFSSGTAASELLNAVRRWRTAGRAVEWSNVGVDVAKMFRAVQPDIELE